MSAGGARRPSAGVNGLCVPAQGRGATRGLRLVAGILIVAGLAGCAGSVAPPVVVASLPAEQRASLRLAGVTTEGGQGVAISPVDTSRITQLVVADIQALAPGVMDRAAAQGKTMRIVITRYDAGNAGARLMLAGLGQIRLDGDVTIVDTPSQRMLAEYKVSKQFALGGIIGSMTSMQDVEKGFAKSVAALVKPDA